METEYLKIGELKIIDGEAFVKPGYYDDGLDVGNIFKDAEAYDKDWDAICYVPEYGVNRCKDNKDGYYGDFDGYTHNDLLCMCNGNRELCDYFFTKLLWAYPRTYMGEMDDEDVAYFYRFIKPGAKVWWNDPAGETSGEYTVWGCPFEFDDHGEPVEPESFSSDAIIIIGTDNSEAEVTPFELTPIY